MKNEEKILDAALKVVEEHTISGTRMHLIAQEAGMLQSNVHYYYKTKDDLMLALQDKVLDKCHEIRDELSAKADDTLESQLDVFIGQKKNFILENKRYDYAEMDFWQQGRINEEMRKRFADSYCGWRKDILDMLDRYVPNLTSSMRQYIPAYVVSFLEGATIQYLMDSDSMDIDGYFEFGKQTILNILKPYCDDN